MAINHESGKGVSQMRYFSWIFGS